MTAWAAEAERMAKKDATLAAAFEELAAAQPDVDPRLPVGAWFDRVLAAYGDRQRWLQVRQRVATATMTSELLLHPGPAFRRRTIGEMLAEPVEITGNRYIDRGHEREPHIAAWVAREWPGIRGNDLLLASAENERHAATPDLLGSGFPPSTVQPELVCGDIKTSKHDLRPSRREGYFWRTHYYGQLQWQMYVTGTRWALFVWERHDDVWPYPEPLELEPEWEWVGRDDAYIARMVAAADQLLAELDQARVDALQDVAVGVAQQALADEGWEGSPVDEATELRRTVAGLGLAVLDARRAEDDAKARKAKPWTELQTLLASSRSDTWRDGQVAVTWTNEEATESAPDLEAALAAHVEGLDEDVTGEDLQADLQRARSAWEAHQARHTKVRTISKQRLTVTAVKPPKESTP